MEESEEGLHREGPRQRARDEGPHTDAARAPPTKGRSHRAGMRALCMRERVALPGGLRGRRGGPADAASPGRPGSPPRPPPPPFPPSRPGNVQIFSESAVRVSLLSRVEVVAVLESSRQSTSLCTVLSLSPSLPLRSPLLSLSFCSLVLSLAQTSLIEVVIERARSSAVERGLLVRAVTTGSSSALSSSLSALSHLSLSLSLCERALSRDGHATMRRART